MASDLVSPQSPSAPPPPSERRYVAFDCETTGLNPERDGIISIGAIGIRHGEILLDDTCEAVLKTDYATPAMLVHGITLNESAAGIDEAAAVRAFLEYSKDAVFVGHHVGFDCRIVAAAARRHNLEHDRMRAIDTMRLALGLDEIERTMERLPRERTPTPADWRRINQSMREEIDGRIALLSRTRSRLDECIGCGCMSFERCQRTNREDRAAGAGPGPRFVLQD